MIAWGVKRGLALAALLVVSACAGGAPIASVPAQERTAIETRLMRDIEVLASDEFGGRKPGTLGEERTVAFITEQLQNAGLVSGTNDPGSAWRAPVELVSTQAFTSRLVIRTGRRETELDEANAAAFTDRRRELVDSEQLVFVGREAEGVSAEEISGSVVVMLGEPGVSPQRRSILFEKGPAAIITVVEDEASIERLNRAYGRERIQLESEADASLTAFVTDAAMTQALGEGWQQLVDYAGEESFAPVEIDAEATIEAASQRREFTSYNVLGKLPGLEPGSGAVVLMGHWDHLGECGSEDDEDRICNGAVDNASGIAVMIELARRLAATGPYDRDIYFLATSAEESGLLGAKAFAEAPPVPLESIVAVFNFDTVAVAPQGSSVGFVGEGRTPLDPVILEVMQQAGRELGSKDFAERFLQRQDGWALLQEGVPAVFLSTSFGSEIVLGPYLSSDYHRPGDELDIIELGGAIDDLLLHEELVRRFADTATYSPPAAE
ncbi:M20/M25/M40 family metallo-hydrolase [Erythrobacter sp. GH1-10]|uniref:M20/M25/M40 family metallo-hydrolase n=1 Tax=Erythrobacter sp. GH1-10 TaxID=3349334 RepID=UPI0038780D07